MTERCEWQREKEAEVLDALSAAEDAYDPDALPATWETHRNGVTCGHGSVTLDGSPTVCPRCEDLHPHVVRHLDGTCTWDRHGPDRRILWNEEEQIEEGWTR